MIVTGPSRRRPSEIDFLLDCDPDAVNNTNTITRLLGKTVNETWVNNITLNNIKTSDYTRTLDKLTSEVVKVYGPDGTTVVGQKTVTYARTLDKVTTITTTRNI